MVAGHDGSRAAFGRLQLYDAPAHGQGDLVRRTLSLSLSWIVVRSHFNRFRFETGIRSE